MLLRPPVASSAAHMAVAIARAACTPLLASSSSAVSSLSLHRRLPFFAPSPPPRLRLSPKPSLFARGLHDRPSGRVCAAEGCSESSPSPATTTKKKKKKKKVKKEAELEVVICLDEGLPDDPEFMSIAERVELDAPMATKLAFDCLKGPTYKTRDTALSDIGGYQFIEVSVLLCNDELIRELNREWRNEDHATDVLSVSSHMPGFQLPVLMLGDIVISLETATRQAEERGHTIIDEIRILLVHGLLHLMGFDHEISEEAESEMEKEEERILKSLGWKGKGLIQSASDPETTINLHVRKQDDRKKEGSLRFYIPKFKYIFCDMDGTLLNSKSQMSKVNAAALKEASSRGLNVVIATGKARPAVIEIMKMAGLAGKDGIVSESSPGVYLQGLLVYGRDGQEIFRQNLDANVCREACIYSLEHKVPLIAFCEGRCLSLFHHPLVDSLHTIYHEAQAEIMPSVDHLLAAADIQKLIFLDTPEGIAKTIRPYWEKATKGQANVVQAVPNMLEIVPLGTNKGSGVRKLLTHLGVTEEEIMAVGDGENDIEMLELASLGISMSNGAKKTKAVANVVGLSNDEDGVADAIYRYAF